MDGISILGLDGEISIQGPQDLVVPGGRAHQPTSKLAPGDALAKKNQMSATSAVRRAESPQWSSRARKAQERLGPFVLQCRRYRRPVHDFGNRDRFGQVVDVPVEPLGAAQVPPEARPEPARPSSAPDVDVGPRRHLKVSELADREDRASLRRQEEQVDTWDSADHLRDSSHHSFGEGTCFPSSFVRAS